MEQPGGYNSADDESRLFLELEREFAGIGLPDMSANEVEAELERHIAHSVDPLHSAKAIQYYASTQSPDAHELILRKYIDILNYRFMTSHLGSRTRVIIEKEFFISNLGQLQDMLGITNELAEKGEVIVGGKLHFFEKHYYINPINTQLEAKLALRLYDGAFIQKYKEGERTVGVDNYITVPVTAISAHEISERETE